MFHSPFHIPFHISFHSAFRFLHITLAERRIKLKLCQLYNILHGHCYFPKIFLCALQIITLLDPITWLLVSPLHTPILFYIHLYPIPYLCGIICLKSTYLLPPYKLLRNYFNHCFISSCHYFTLVVLVCLINFYCGYVSY